MPSKTFKTYPKTAYCMQKEKATIVLPTYNERGNIEQLSLELIKELKGSGHSPEIIIVDDNSPDGTGQLAEHLAKKHREIKAIVRKNERGLATAILRGINESSGSIIVLMDCDFSHPPQFVPELLKQLESADAVFASRYAKGGRMETDKIQYCLSRMFNHSIKLMLGINVIDSTNGFLAIRRAALQGIRMEKVFTGYGDYCFKMIYALKSRKPRIKEIPFRYMPRRYGKSKTSLLKAGLTYWKEALKLRLGL